ncbi:hypothetical protein B7463_g8776, partial [Scytalidium lignicola]
MSSATIPVYFEESWAILSSLCLVDVLFGLMVVGITSVSPISLVPIITSAAGAIADGLCYYAFYADYQKTGTIVAGAVADVSWLIQEAGMSFYSYIILTRILAYRERVIFMWIFWFMIIVITAIRIIILQTRVRSIINGGTTLQPLIDHLHVGYFTSIAILECVSAFFLLRKFAAAKKTSKEVASTSGLFGYLMKSTEIRVSILAVIGFSRAITYSFQTQQQAATSVASQVDRFVYTLECMFPVMMFIDILASKYVLSAQSNYNNSSSGRNQRSDPSQIFRTRRGSTEIGLYSMNAVETRVDAKTVASSSQERIVEDMQSAAATLDGEEGSSERDRDAHEVIKKTVEFEFHEHSVGD